MVLENALGVGAEFTAAAPVLVVAARLLGGTAARNVSWGSVRGQQPCAWVLKIRGAETGCRQTAARRPGCSPERHGRQRGGTSGRPGNGTTPGSLRGCLGRQVGRLQVLIMETHSGGIGVVDSRTRQALVRSLVPSGPSTDRPLADYFCCYYDSFQHSVLCRAPWGLPAASTHLTTQKHTLWFKVLPNSE
jgi:hypothetical protein